MPGMIHPEHVGGRSLWMDAGMTELIDKLHYGDPVIGWEGDERLAVYWNDPRWEIWRCEVDNKYRMVCRSKPGVLFDERVLMQLRDYDSRRVQRDLFVENNAHNDKIDADKKSAFDEWITEEAAPRLAHAFRQDM